MSKQLKDNSCYYVRAFSLLGDGSDEHQINIKRTPEEPLFQANQISKLYKLLGIANISTVLKDFSVKERCLISKEGPLFSKEGSKISNDRPLISNEGSFPKEESFVQTNFLTELGLYRLLGRSIKPIAVHFKSG